MPILTDIYGPPVYVYTRRQAFEDGILVDLMGTYDDWPAAMVREAGITIPVAITATVFNDCISPIEDENGQPERGEVLEPGQDIKGRLWDVLWMFRNAATGRNGRNASALLFRLLVVPNNPAGSTRHRRARPVTLKAVMGGDDDGNPCITIMYPSED